MTPIEEGEDVDESEVIYVTAPDGEQRRYRKRKMGLDQMRNGKFSNNFVQGAIRNLTLVQLFCGALAAFGVVMLGIAEWAVIPQLEKKIERTMAPLVERVALAEKALADHRIDVAEKSRLYPTRTELKEDLDEIKQMLRDAEGRR